jgi:hypothetical protein
MTSPTIHWTDALQAAAAALSVARYDYECTIPERGDELARHMRPGQALTGMQLDCVAMLRSRMHSRTVEETAFNEAWGIAWDAGQIPPDASYDSALA